MITTLALVASLALADLPAPAKQVGLTPESWSKVESGEVITKAETFKTAEGKDGGRGHAWAIINATPDACYATLHKYEDLALFMPRVKKITFLKKEETSMRVIQEIKVALSTYRYNLDLAYDPAGKAMSWTLAKELKNDIKDTTGSWRFIPLEGGKTLVDYTVAVDTGMSVPRFLSDYLTQRDLPEVINAFKKRVESGGKYVKD